MPVNSRVCCGYRGEFRCVVFSIKTNADSFETEKIATEYPDSALAILESIDPSDITADSLKAKLYYLKAYGHMSCHRSMVGDSLITFAHNYYRGKDIVKDVRSGIALAWYRFWAGDTPDSIAL